MAEGEHNQGMRRARSVRGLSCVVAVMVVSLWAAGSAAQTGSWGAGPGSSRCVLNPTADGGFEGHLSKTERATRRMSQSTDGCESGGRASDSNNVCFEGAGAPATVSPEVVFGDFWGTTRLPTSTPDRGERFERIFPDGAFASHSGPVGTPDEPDPKYACTSDPDMCQSVPPGPTTLKVEVTAPAAELEARLEEIDEPHIEQDDSRTSLRVGPARGHDGEVFQPPRLG